MTYLPPLVLVSIQCPDVAYLGPMGKAMFSGRSGVGDPSEFFLPLEGGRKAAPVP